jgi:hypothetical protein
VFSQVKTGFDQPGRHKVHNQPRISKMEGRLGKNGLAS